MRTTASRGYGSGDEDEVARFQDDPAAMQDAHGTDTGHGQQDHEEGHGHGPTDPDVTPNTIDDVYITSGDRAADTVPIGFLSPTRLLEKIPPPPHAYEVNYFQAILVGVLATIPFILLWYPLYFGYGDSSFDLGMILGALVSPALDNLTRLIGLGILFGIGGGTALVYAVVLKVFRTQSSVGRGAQLGLAGWAGMTSFGMIALIAFVARWAPGHPYFDMVDINFNQAGPSNLGYAPIIIALFPYLAYGALVGAWYRHKTLLPLAEPGTFAAGARA